MTEDDCEESESGTNQPFHASSDEGPDYKLSESEAANSNSSDQDSNVPETIEILPGAVQDLPDEINTNPRMFTYFCISCIIPLMFYYFRSTP